MSRRNVGRTSPPAFGSFRSGNRRIWIAALLPVVVAVPALWYYFYPPTEAVEDIEAFVRKYYRFEPLTPPSRLRSPGSIYLIEGALMRKVCDARRHLSSEDIDESETYSRIRTGDTKSRFELSGGFVSMLNAKLMGARVESIEFGMRDVTIREIPEAILGKIERQLMADPDCEDAVHDLLTANKKVCSGSASLTASISYKVRFDRRSDLTAQAKLAVADAIRESIEENGGGTVSVRNAEEFSGEKLIYGILLSPRCLELNATPGRTSGTGRPSQQATGPKT